MENTGPKRHHYVTAGYLAAFATPPTRYGRLGQADTQQPGLVRPTTPDTAAAKRHYYRVDIDGVDPNLVEYEFGKIEGEALPIIRKAVKDRALPDGRPLDADVVRHHRAFPLPGTVRTGRQRHAG